MTNHELNLSWMLKVAFNCTPRFPIYDFLLGHNNMDSVTSDTNMKSFVWSPVALSALSDFEIASSRSLIFQALIFFL